MSADVVVPESRHEIIWTRRRVLHRGVTAIGIGLLAACGCAPAIKQPRVPTVGFVSPFAPDLEQFLRPVRALGYVEGQTLTIASRTGVPETAEELAPLVDGLVRLPADIIVAVGSTAAGIAKGKTTKIPVVFFGVADAVALGLVVNVARPEGNLTGVTNVSAQAIGKGLEYLVQFAPGGARVAFVGNLGENPGSLLQLAAAQAAAKTIGVPIVDFALRDASDIDRVFDSLSSGGVKAVMVGSDGITLRSQQRLVENAARVRLPTIYTRREFADAGGLIAYGPSYPALWERCAALVDKLARGSAPGDLPVEQPASFDLIVNFKTAKALGIPVPQAIVAQATEVIQ